MSHRALLRSLPILSSLAALFISAGSASAQTLLADWHTFALANGGYPGDLAPTYSDENLEVSSLVRAAGLSAPGSVPNKWVGSAATRFTTMSAAIAANNYFTFSVAPEDGSSLSITSLSFAPVAAGTRSINAFQWQYSIDGGEFVNFGASVSHTTAFGPVTEVDGVDFNVVSGSTAVFRLVAWAGGSTSGGANTIWGLGYDTVGDAPGLAIFGTVASAVPEPASAAALLGAAALAGVGLRRRRRVV